MSRVKSIEALAWKRGVDELTKEPTDIGSTPNLFPTLRSLRWSKSYALRKDIKRWPICPHELA